MSTSFCAREGPPIVSASDQVSVSLSPSPFRVTSAPCLRTQCRSFYERFSLPLRQLALTLDPPGLLKSAACPRLSRSTVTGRFPLSLCQPLGPPVRCFCSFYLRDIQHEYDGLLSLGHFVAAGSRIGWPSPLPD